MHALEFILDDSTSVTNREIEKSALEDWASTLKPLWDILGKPINPTQFSVHVKMLSDVPLGLLEEAVRRVINGRIYSNIPTPGEIRKEITTILNETQTYNIEAWIEASWSKVMRHSIDFANRSGGTE